MKWIDIIRITITGITITGVIAGSVSCAPIKVTVPREELVNRMTDEEKSRSEETDFMLLEDPWDDSSIESQFADLTDRIIYNPGYGALVHGEAVFNALPPVGYDGGSGTVYFDFFDPDTGEIVEEEIVFEDMDELRDALREGYDREIAAGYPSVPADEEYEALIDLYEAVIAGETEDIDKDLFDRYMDYYYNGGAGAEPVDLSWQMDEEGVAEIRDSIREYHIYDEELDTTFVVHVTTPPGYDESLVYPALVMTDAVWRFSDIPYLYDVMASGEGDPQIMVTIGFGYDVDNTDNEIRANIFCDNRKGFLDFITDNLMPYLGERYRFDYGSSTLFGHSQGGVFTHYAAFNFDLYENKPFARYMICSPTFWTPYFTCVEGYEEYKNEYGYSERNPSYDRELIITAGDMEDEDYSEYYGDNDSTTEGVAHLTERLDSHNVTTYTVKIYESHHYQYVSGMLIEFVQGNFRRT